MLACCCCLLLLLLFVCLFVCLLACLFVGLFICLLDDFICCYLLAINIYYYIFPGRFNFLHAYKKKQRHRKSKQEANKLTKTEQ